MWKMVQQVRQAIYLIAVIWDYFFASQLLFFHVDGFSFFFVICCLVRLLCVCDIMDKDYHCTKEIGIWVNNYKLRL